MTRQKAIEINVGEKRTNALPNSPKHSATQEKIFKVDGPFYSDAFKCWRVTIFEKRGPFFDDRWEGALHIERKEDADSIAVLLPKVRNFADFDLLISNIKSKVMRASQTKGFCYAYAPGRFGEPLHRTTTA